MSVLERVWAATTRSCAYRNVPVPACARAAKDEVAGAASAGGASEAEVLSLLLRKCLAPCSDPACASCSRVPAVHAAPSTGSEPATPAGDNGDDDNSDDDDDKGGRLSSAVCGVVFTFLHIVHYCNGLEYHERFAAALLSAVLDAQLPHFVNDGDDARESQRVVALGSGFVGC